jgi:hypothetical protein
MRTIDELEKELRRARALSGWYGIRRDGAMQKHYAFEGYRLFVELENRRRAAQL